MNKRALIFSISLVLITLGTLLTLIIVITNLEKQISTTKTIGERAIDILALRTTEEQTTFFIEQAAKIAAEKATQEFLKNAGLLNTDCGKIEDIVLWNTADKNCFETKFYENYKELFNKQLNQYIEVFVKTTKQKIPLSNYNIFINDGKTISGIAVQPVEKDILTDTTKTGLHAFKPSFNAPFQEDFTVFPKLKTFAHEVLACSNSKDQQNKEECIQGIISRTEVPLTMRKINEDIFAFEIKGRLTFALTVILT